MKLTEDSDARMTPCPNTLDEAEPEAGDTADTDSEVSDATHTESESPPASTVQNESSGQYAFSSDVSGDEDSGMTLLTDGIDQGDPEPIATRKEVVPVRLPAVCTHRTADTNWRAH
jgi:hypothetical protein